MSKSKAQEWRNRIVDQGERPAGDFLANPKNWRVHPKAQREALTGVLSEVGWVQSVIVNRTTGHVVDGHARIEEALKLGDETPVPFVEVELSEAEEAKILATIDPISAMAGADKAALDSLLHEVETSSAAVGEMLAELAEKNGLEYGGENVTTDADAEPQIDRAEELRAKWQTEPGQLWRIGEHRLLCGDSTRREDVERVMSGERAECVFTDPPYGVNIQGGKNNSTIAGDITQTAIPFSFDLACDAATTDDARLYFCGGEGNIGLYAKLFERYCRQLPRHLIWVKNGFVMKPNGYHNQYEIIFHGYKPKGGGLNKWFGGRKEDEASDVWQIKRDASSTYLHPTQKPIELPMRAINNSCPPGGIVYEPFGGSGSTIVACQQLGRKCRAIEISPAYVAVILERMKTAFPLLEIVKLDT